MSATQTTTAEPSKSTAGVPGVVAAPVLAPQQPAPTDVSASEAEKCESEKREALIRIAAYSFYERRGYVSGHELEDWLQAEMEVDRQLGAAPVPKPTN